MSVYERALKLAAKAHAGQVRKHDNTPYIAHPIMVARILEQYGFAEEVVAAGLVHDVLEDTTVTEAELKEALGAEVVDMVVSVSEDKDLPWEERKEAYIKAVLSSTASVWALSVADKVHNAEEFISFHASSGAAAWSIFNRDKEKKLWFERLLHAELSKVWSHPLLVVYAKKIAELELLVD
jgi:guanosine-3',5'-bis(diphosphate) 3'-pyrophosphohydrolase